ncbi:MAG: hypothetical protein HQL67_03495 [Magnetococcales bacterium]|nr:hypothetical protein [Magnetococcales bacterium]
MGHIKKPLFRNVVLIISSGVIIAGITAFGIADVDELIREDNRLGPVIAASRIIVPLFGVIGVAYLLGNIRKCEACGKVFFWRRRRKSE